MRDQARVVQRLSHVDVPIQTDRTEAQYGRGATHDVRRYPNVAEFWSEMPSVQVVDDGECHDSQRDQSVGDGERDEKIVSGPTEISIGEYGDDD